MGFEWGIVVGGAILNLGEGVVKILWVFFIYVGDLVK